MDAKLDEHCSLNNEDYDESRSGPLKMNLVLVMTNAINRQLHGQQLLFVPDDMNNAGGVAELCLLPT